MAYTQEGIMAQVWIAFGQGAGAIRVSHDAAMELRRWYYDAITPEVINEKWQTDAVQALDRIRATDVCLPGATLRVFKQRVGRILPLDISPVFSAIFRVFPKPRRNVARIEW